MLSQRLANSVETIHAPDPAFGRSHAERQEAAFRGLADDMLASEPFCWLLKDAYPSHSELAEKRRDGMIDIFRKAVKFFKACEIWLNGQPVLRGIAELRDVYRDCVNEVRLYYYCWQP
jgi:hypothetical protein